MSIVEVGDRTGEEYTVDIVAVHGLYEDSVQTWTDNETGVSWLKDLLPKRLPQARILTYGYRANVLSAGGQSSSDRILSLALTLVADLNADRDLNDAIDRPIIFLCHGLGGVLVKRALAFSNTSRAKQVEHRRSIFTSTYAILFLGSPHYGIELAALQAYAKNNSGNTPNDFSLSLKRGSEILQDIHDQFSPLSKRFSIYLFWEQLESDLTPSRGESDLVPSRGYVVSRESAAPPWDNVERAGIYATHSRMCKFTTADDAGFKLVLSACLRYTRHALKVIPDRWREDKARLVEEREQEAAELIRHDSGLLAHKGESRAHNEYFVASRSASSIFTGRDDIAKLLRQKIITTPYEKGNQQHKIFVIWGLGGSGKTQFCLKFIEDNRDSFWGIFWIDASSDQTAEVGFANLGHLANKDTTFDAGKHWLSSSAKPWLLILDNADDPSMDISRFFPAGGRGHILVTTRNPNNVVHATIGEANFRELNEEDAITLLLKAAHQPGSEDYKDSKQRNLARPITSVLGYLALALTHAGATIRRRLCTLESYLRIYSQELMQQRPASITAHSLSIITTYEVPFMVMRKKKDIPSMDASDILHVFAFLHNEAIPKAIFRKAWNNLQVLGPSEDNRRQLSPNLWFGNTSSQPRTQPSSHLWTEKMWNERRLRDAFAVLRELSFIDYDDSEDLCSLHPIVHLWARQRLPVEEQKHWLGITTSLLANSITPEMEASSREYRRFLILHIGACLQPRYGDALYMKISTVDDALKAERFAAVFAENGDWKRARSIGQQVLNIRKAKLGQSHPKTLEAMAELGQIYWDLFDVPKAVEIRHKIYETALKKSRKPDYLTFKAMSDLTITYWLAGDRRKSEHYGLTAVAGLTHLRGDSDPATLTARFNLARTQFHLGHYEKARRSLEEVFLVRERFFGTNHPDTLMAMAELAAARHALSQTADAKVLIKQVVAVRSRILGVEHAYTLWSINDLSKVLTDSGRAAKALKKLEDIIPIVTRTLGHQHVGMHMTRFNQARALNGLGRHAEAEDLLRKQVRSTHATHPDHAVAMGELARTCRAQGRLDDAVQLYLATLEAMEKRWKLGVDFTRLKKLAEELNEIYVERGKARDMEELKKRIASLQEDDKEFAEGE